jgi:hypothetical protein
MNIGRQLAAVAAIALCSSAAADNGPHVIVIQTASPERQFHERWERGDHAGALEAINRALRSRPNDAMLLYNRACAETQLGDLDAAARSLMDAVRHGFSAFSHMQRDGDLAPLREHAVYRAILDARRFADDILAERRTDEWRERLDSDRYRHVRDEAHRLNYFHTLDEDTWTRVQAAIDTHLAVLNEMLFSDPPALWTLAILPAADLTDSLITRDHARGSYRHHHRELIAQDHDVALRHELIHLLHHRHMDQLGQQHPMWMQEGLAVIFEEYVVNTEGEVTFIPGARFNHAKRLLRDDRLLPLRELLAMSDQQFNRHARITYAQVDALMRFIDQETGIAAWYSTQIERHEKDATGIYALEALLDGSIDEIDQRFRTWLESQSFFVR